MRSIWTALFSNRRTETPRRASTVAIAAPATPAPAITTSVVWDIPLDTSTAQGIAVDLEPRSAPGLDALIKNPMVDASQLALRAVSCGPPARHVGLKDIEFPRTSQEVVEGFLTRRSLVERRMSPMGQSRRLADGHESACLPISDMSGRCQIRRHRGGALGHLNRVITRRPRRRDDGPGS